MDYKVDDKNVSKKQKVYKFDFERIARESHTWPRPPTKAQKQLEMEIFGKLRDHRPRFTSFRKRLRYEKRHQPASLWDGIIMSDDKEKYKYKEELRRHNQAKLSIRLHQKTARRFGVSKLDEYEIPLSRWLLVKSDFAPAKKNKRQQKKQLQLSRSSPQLRVSVHPYRVRGHSRELEETGTLQAHANGFRFINYSVPFQMDVMYDNVKRAFFQDGDENIAPFLHLHLHNPIVLGTETTKDIQFHMVQTFGGRRSKGMLALVSDKVDGKEGGKTLDNQLMQMFVSKVNYLWEPLSSIEFKKIQRNREFPAEVCIKENTFSCSFVMTLDCLVHLREAPYIVMTLKDIELVNLVQHPSEQEVFHITFVFRDFELDVLHVNSISSVYLLRIKQWLDRGGVKYYENEEDIPNWRDKLNMIIDDPQTFIDGGGWNFLNSGENDSQSSDSYVDSLLGNHSDSSTESSVNYSNVTSDESDSGPENNEMCTTRTKLTTPVVRRANVFISDSDESDS